MTGQLFNFQEKFRENIKEPRLARFENEVFLILSMSTFENVFKF